jgi:hypothetical protein
MVLYTCLNCNKEFKKKSHYIDHTENKKKPCNNTNTDINNNIPNVNQIKPNVNQMIPNINQTIFKNTENCKCNYCLKTFVNTSSLNRHLKDRCKVKKLDEEKKEEIFNKLIEKEEKFNILLESFEKMQKFTENLQKNYFEVQKSNEYLQKNYEYLEKNNKDLQKNNKDLQKQMKELKKETENKIKDCTKNYDEKIKQVITKNINNTINNTVNNTDNSVKIIIPAEKLVKFGNEDLTKIDHKDIINSMKNWQVTGYHVFIELLKLIHFNPKLPECQNIYMTDRNREKFMSYDGKIWELNDTALYETTQHIEKLKNTYEEEFEIEITKNKSVKHTIDKLNKFTDKYFEGDEEGNKNNDFIKLVNGQIMDYMYNHKDDIKMNFELIKDEVLKKNNNKKILLSK